MFLRDGVTPGDFTTPLRGGVTLGGRDWSSSLGQWACTPP